MGLKQRGALWAGLTLALTAAPAWPAGLESLGAGAQGLFFQAAGSAGPRFTRRETQTALSLSLPAGLLGKESRFSLATLSALAQVQFSAAVAQEILLEPLLNRQFKTNLSYTLGGKSVWIGGAFDRVQKAYVAILEDGKAARFFNVEELRAHAEVLDLGAAKYKLSLSPDYSDLLDSEIILTNTNNKKDSQWFSLRDMLAAVAAVGAPARIGGADYKVFYYDDIQDGKASSASRSFAFILTDVNRQIRVFLVPAELVAGDRIAVFRMHDNKPVGLQQVGSTLKLFDNP